MKNVHVTKKQKQIGTHYSRTHRVGAFLLFFVLTLLPLAPAFADEGMEPSLEQGIETTYQSVGVGELATSGEVETEMIQRTVPELVEPVSEPSAETESESGDVNTDTETIDEQDTLPPAPPESDTASGSVDTESTPPATESDASDTSDTPLDDVDVTEPAPADTGGTDGEDILSENAPLPPVEGTTTEPVPEETAEDKTATASDAVVDIVQNESNKFSFSEQQCTMVGDGTFYCTSGEMKAEVAHTDRIFSAPDEDGDKEIFVEQDGELSQLTKNAYDDDAPYYDEASNTAVWHRLIDGRYQILQFDFETGEEVQLTNGRENSMQPSCYGDTVVWQSWVGNDWEIVLYDGERVTYLTDNDTHDIAPSIYDEHVVWQSFVNGAWVMNVFDIQTGDTKTISDTDGGTIANPRFVLVYDAKMDTGDVETRGYDFSSGQVIRLGSKPVSLPEEIPDPEQTGEERALVTSPVQPKSKLDGNTSGGDPNADGIVPDPDPDSTDVVVPPFDGGVLVGDDSASSTLDTAEPAPSDVSTVTDATSTTPSTGDILVPAFESASSTDTEHIEDLVIEPYVPATDVIEVASEQN